jgi:hypothetical protein
LSTTGSISLGCALVAGKNLVPKPATGNTAFVIPALAIFGLPAFIESPKAAMFLSFV